MRIDLHCHVKLSKAADFDPSHFLKLVRIAGKQGLDGIAVTEHIYTNGFMNIFRYLDGEFPYVQEYYSADGLKIFSGIELDVRENKGHILAIGNREDIKSIASGILLKNSVPSLKELLAFLRSYPVITIGAHPFRPGHPLYREDTNQLKQLDFLELNAKDIRMRKELEALSGLLGRKIVCGSDTHHPLQLGCVANELADDCSTIAQLKACIRDDRYRLLVSPYIHPKLFLARTLKKHWKTRMLKTMGM